MLDFSSFLHALEPVEAVLCFVIFNICIVYCVEQIVVEVFDAGLLTLLVEDVVLSAAKTQVRDIFGFEMISANKYTTAEVDKEVWPVSMLDELVAFIQSDPRCEQYRDIDWAPDYEKAKAQAENSESAL